MDDPYDALTEKEKQALRLMVRGHDAKSMARELSLSVHTINERLRDSRRKLGVTSSREAARLVFEREGGSPQYLADKDFGDAAGGPVNDEARSALGGIVRHPRLAGTIAMMTLFAAGLILASQFAATDSQETPSSIQAEDKATSSAARDWLELVDAGDWQASFDAAGESFRDVNTPDGWANASRQVRAPLGAAQSRELIEMRYLNAPPAGYREARFRTLFENGTTAFETVTLEREDGRWRVVGYMID